MGASAASAVTAASECRMMAAYSTHVHRLPTTVTLLLMIMQLLSGCVVRSSSNDPELQAPSMVRPHKGPCCAVCCLWSCSEQWSGTCKQANQCTPQCLCPSKDSQCPSNQIDGQVRSPLCEFLLEVCGCTLGKGLALTISYNCSSGDAMRK
jgi:hypothetical protein